MGTRFTGNKNAPLSSPRKNNHHLYFIQHERRGGGRENHDFPKHLCGGAQLSFSSFQSHSLLAQHTAVTGNSDCTALPVLWGVILQNLGVFTGNVTADFWVTSGTKSSTFPAFYFPVENIESFVEVHPLRAVSLQAFTLCFWSRAQPVGSQTILSYSTGERDRELVVTVGSELGLWVGGHFLSFPLQQEARGWLHHCVTWASPEGSASLWLNGAAGKAQSVQKGYVSRAGGTLVLGKDRDALLGTFSNGFGGWLSRVNLWSRVLSAAELRALALCKAGQPTGDVIAWGQTPMALLGGVLLQPDTSCQ